MKIPGHVLRLMWEYDRAVLQGGAEFPDALLERVMSAGGVSQMRWLLQAVDRARLAAYLESRGRRVLPARELRFWCHMAGIEESMASEWVRNARARERSWH